MSCQDAGAGLGRGACAGAEAFDDHLALGLSPFEALPVGQHHRAQCGGDQQRAGDLERPQVAGEDQGGQALHVAFGIGLVEADESGGRRAADAGDQQDAKGQSAQDGRNPLAAKGFHQGLRGVDADDHEDEQEQHHHRTGVDHHLHHAEEQRILSDVDHGQRDHGGGQADRGVDRLGCGDDADGTDDGEGAQNPEHHRLGCRCAGEGFGRQEGDRHCVTSCPPVTLPR